ncbi:MAG: carbon-nitrogen hydrolase family protein [Helicobacteraceae bacterium]|nr:carbon-nitrogen hydrolase family protein [Helicobacteraceae bacterium]
MTISKPDFIERPLCSLSFKSENHSYEENLTSLLSLVKQTPVDAVIVFPELAITNFDYDNFEAAAAYSEVITKKLLEAAQEKIIVATMIEKLEDGRIYNVAKVFHSGAVVHKQAKVELFKFGGEHDYFSAGSESEITLFEIDGITFGLLICFEIRFKQFWKLLEGADIMLIPAQWGKLRAQNFVSLTNALAIINQCYIVASDTDNSDTTGMSGIVSPFGDEIRNGKQLCLTETYKEKEVRKMRRYLDVGIA